MFLVVHEFVYVAENEDWNILQIVVDKSLLVRSCSERGLTQILFGSKPAAEMACGVHVHCSHEGANTGCSIEGPHLLQDENCPGEPACRHRQLIAPGKAFLWYQYCVPL